MYLFSPSLKLPVTIIIRSIKTIKLVKGAEKGSSKNMVTTVATGIKAIIIPLIIFPA